MSDKDFYAKYMKNSQLNSKKTNNSIKKQAKDLNRCFIKDNNTWMANKNMERCSIL